MKVEGYLFSVYFVFLAIISVIYYLLSGEWVGTLCLALSGGLALIVGYYLLFTARRIDARPEDRVDAEIAEGAGEIGFFAPHSWWPIALAAGFSIVMIGLVIGPFLALMGGLLLVVALFGLLFEYYVGINRTQGQTLGALQAMGERPTSPHKFLGD